MSHSPEADIAQLQSAMDADAAVANLATAAAATDEHHMNTPGLMSPLTAVSSSEEQQFAAMAAAMSDHNESPEPAPTK